MLFYNQFHDILPGSLIRRVYEDSARDYADCLAGLAELKQEVLPILSPGGDSGVDVINTPWILLPRNSAESRSWLSIDSPHLVIDNVKMAEDSDAVVVRLYECHGARGTARLHTTLPFREAGRVNLLEENAEPIPGATGGTIPLAFRPFEILALLLVPA